MPVSISLLSAVGVQLLCQAFKVVFYSLKDRRFRPGYFFSAGGMPSAHSAFVTTLSVSLGLRYGFDSELFTISVVFSLIIIYDSVRLRGAVQIHARVLNRLLAHFPGEREGEIPQMVGHSLGEVAAGLAAGAGLAALIYLLMG